MENLFTDRTEAGQLLAGRLQMFGARPDVLVLALPRGGVPVGFEVAKELRAPLDVFLVRKLGVPEHPELAMGAIASGGVLVLNDRVMEMLDIPDEVVNEAAERGMISLQKREAMYRGKEPASNARGRIVILVDDGLATGSSMRAAVTALRQQDPAGILVAVPVGAAEACAELEGEVEQILCLETPNPFYAVGIYYRHFAQVTDDEVKDLLQQSLEYRPVRAGDWLNGENGE